LSWLRNLVDSDARLLRHFFDADWYLQQNPDVRSAGVDPLRHYLKFGWKEGRNPTPYFFGDKYLELHGDIASSGVNPFAHYIRYGIAEGRLADSDAQLMRHFFNAGWYLDQNADVRKAKMDAFQHYYEHGWKDGRNPTPYFDSATYLEFNPEVAEAGTNPFLHFLRSGLLDGSLGGGSPGHLPPSFSHDRAFHSVQDQTFPKAAEKAEKLLVILIPEHNEMSGGIFSFFSIARAARNLRTKHDYEVLLMTRPNKLDVTYTRQTNFQNFADVFRFDQIVRCRAARTIYLHVPEYAAPTLVENMKSATFKYLRSREHLYVNILNQKIDLMSEKEEFEDLRALAHELTQSVAHHAYFSQSFADRYDMPTLLLPAYTDLSAYDPIPFEDKEKLIIYSPDDAPWKTDMLRALKEGLPDYKLRQIKGISFDSFMDLATRCRFSITFGEGFDGYLAQPIYQGGVGFAVYNEQFFPSKDMASFKNIFQSEEDILANLVARIKELEAPDAYKKANRQMMEVYDRLYSKSDYLARVLKLINREFEYHPLHLSGHLSGASGTVRL
jgi:hypothetical protein